SLHTGEMRFDEAVEFMTKKGNLTPPNAKAEVGRYCSWPTQASSYLTGMLEIVDIRTRWLAKRGAADRPALRAFHDAITTTDSIPVAGQLDDVIVASIALRVVLASSEERVVRDHWRGDAATLDRILRIVRLGRRAPPRAVP